MGIADNSKFKVGDNVVYAFGVEKVKTTFGEYEPYLPLKNVVFTVQSVHATLSNPQKFFYNIISNVYNYKLVKEEHLYWIPDEYLDWKES